MSDKIHPPITELQKFVSKLIDDWAEARTAADASVLKKAEAAKQALAFVSVNSGIRVSPHQTFRAELAAASAEAVMVVVQDPAFSVYSVPVA